MNKLIKSSLFNISTAREQRRQARWLGENSSPRDVRRSDNDWGQVAEAFRKHDPDGRKLVTLFAEEVE
ncbi:MAG: hypothetical protein A3H57_04745 [Candidatus Taylorbacteria bacterium RIFCSPLOWO2_02_FULL_43_11]|uniref:Uncharacterized protein n=1 Tax=Candidatus Taylorbacteria bacterium RIFCSPHIGHO2_02_FULL_43_32b TaxID=1802306 RepID=A0A1G2MKF7_9BACT|nr:MAG: hypothetical protein A2743_03845 [Candidatus Taylorbacteria bacterium RIFCSPHIGHO2_01_FULL_43_47]OHA24425.1 MAG: hypothetical protein A3C72_01910 [Candidatus Taylorbacteria bacterium RIFCSPHIGHO2_02_FULL_43_32b]OHA31553.1 MAG: hypothetical protein A3B08_04405 [Candidatus Taylorbacteria bacterium RIFCSPLOWO2_01_FULL_43_44]OHA35320.1 MAG: hypothetical protein A3H57_04745 [Candidatus Taylorbacteria bacterium RIFCSPLOWO2_02_FULL_43_11]